MASKKFDSHNKLYEQLYGVTIGGNAPHGSGFSIESCRRPLSRRHHGKKTLWACAMAQLYLRGLKSGEVPNYPSEEQFAPARFKVLGGKVDKREEVG